MGGWVGGWVPPTSPSQRGPNMDDQSSDFPFAIIKQKSFTRAIEKSFIMIDRLFSKGDFSIRPSRRRVPAPESGEGIEGRNSKVPRGVTHFLS